MAARLAQFPFANTLDGFDFPAQPSLDPQQLRELARRRWVGNGVCLLLLGPPGVGKRIWLAPRPTPPVASASPPPTTGCPGCSTTCPWPVADGRYPRLLAVLPEPTCWYWMTGAWRR